MKIVVIAPREEHWDGTGGAIATWVENVQAPSSHNLKVLGASGSNGTGWYSSPGRLQLAKATITRTAGVLSSLLQMPAKKIENAIWLRGLLYILLLLPEIRNADIVYIHNRPLYTRFLRIFGFSGRIILHMHNHATPYFRRMSATDVQRIDHFLFCSEFIRTAAVNECHIPKERTGVLYNGVPGVLAQGLSPMSLDLIFVGRLQEIKGADVAIRTISILREKGHEATLTLVGGTETGLHDSHTPYSSKLTQLAESVNAAYGPNVIRFLGPRPLSEVLDRMSRTPLFIFPSRTDEAFGMVLAESISRGSYPLVTATGGMPEILEIAGLSGYNSLYDAAEFANAALDAQGTITEDLRIAAAQKILARLNWSRIRADYENSLVEFVEFIP